MKHVMGNYQELAASLADQRTYPLSYLSEDWSDVAVWQTIGRAAALDALSYRPRACPLNAAVGRKYERDGLIIEHVSYDQPAGPRTEGIFLYPIDRPSGKLPAIVALHDHGGFKYYGKEKLVDLDNEPGILTRFKRESYEGRSWATELAKRGYAVFVPDVFLWGSRRMTAEQVTEPYSSAVTRHEPGTESYIEAYNQFAGEHEALIAKTLYLAGATWTGIMAYEDRRAVDYLLTRPEVDGGRIGCGGLSGGGLRTIYLAGLDDRISCAVCVGFMSTNKETIANRIKWHTWMFHVPQLSQLLDLPDILSLHGKKPVMVQYDIDDPLWTIQGQRDSDKRLADIYGKMGAADRYCGKFYPGPHKFDMEMQEDAFNWFDQWLSVK